MIWQGIVAALGFRRRYIWDPNSLHLYTLGTGLGLGALLMFVLDPDKGRRRRALVRDKLLRLADSVGDLREWTKGQAENVRNHAWGYVAEARSYLQQEEQDVSDTKLVARVRSEMGRIVSHPGAVTVIALAGQLTLQGPVLAAELPNLLTCVESIPGVKVIKNQLEIHESALESPSF